ncbi:MAG: hypothetical protein J5585_06570 [Clostridia bacterium]|nr:hypothetical protein [Clostridia bacterium]
MKKIFLTKIRKGYNMKRLFCIFTAITVLFSLCIKAGATESDDTNKEDAGTVNALLNKTFELYLLMYRGFSQSSEYVSLPPDKYHENELSKKLTSEGVSKFYALNEDCDTRRKLVSKVSGFLASDLAEKVIQPSLFLYIEGESLAYRYDATNKFKYVLPPDNGDPGIRRISKDGDKETYSFTVECNDPTHSVQEKTVIITGSGENARITGGTFIEDVFELDPNPQTADASIIAVCALALSAAAAAVLIKKKKV